ncbi:hypothetical protein D3C78_1219980 [compost metagenome]
MLRQRQADAVGPELDVEQRAVGDAEAAGDVVAAGEQRVDDGEALLDQFAAVGLDGLVLGRAGGEPVGGEDACEALAVDLAAGQIEHFLHPRQAFGVFGQQLALGIAAPQPPGDGLEVGQRAAVVQHQAGDGGPGVDGQVLGLEVVAGQQVDDMRLEHQLQLFEQDVDAGAARAGGHVELQGHSSAPSWSLRGSSRPCSRSMALKPFITGREIMVSASTRRS